VRGLKVAPESVNDKEKLLKLLDQMLAASTNFSPLPSKINQQPNPPVRSSAPVSFDSAIFYSVIAPALVSEAATLSSEKSLPGPGEQSQTLAAPSKVGATTSEAKPLPRPSSMTNNFNAALYYQLLAPTLIR